MRDIINLVDTLTIKERENVISSPSVREIKKRLKKAGYEIELWWGHVYPNVHKLPEDYPWSRKIREGPIPENYKGRDWPLPCGFIFNCRNLRGLELVNENYPSIVKYHEEIRELLQ